jgi:hypothetical protein
VHELLSASTAPVNSRRYKKHSISWAAVLPENFSSSALSSRGLVVIKMQAAVSGFAKSLRPICSREPRAAKGGFAALEVVRGVYLHCQLVPACRLRPPQAPSFCVNSITGNQ